MSDVALISTSYQCILHVSQIKKTSSIAASAVHRRCFNEEIKIIKSILSEKYEPRGRESYAKIKRKGKTLSAHRYVYEETFGVLPEVVMHRCEIDVASILII